MCPREIFAYWSECWFERVVPTSLLDGEACSADVTAQEDCVLLVIERGQFLALLRANSDLCLHLMTMLTKRLRRANSALEDMALLDLPTRLGRLLGAHGHACSAGALLGKRHRFISKLGPQPAKILQRPLRQVHAHDPFHRRSPKAKDNAPACRAASIRLDT